MTITTVAQRGRSFVAAVLACGLCLSAAAASAAEPSLRELIDRETAAAWAKEKITASPAAGDSEFLRRVYLDIVGAIPTYDETVAFISDAAPDKRARLIDQLLDDPRHAQHQADLWDMILFGRNPPGFDTDKREAFQTWLREQFAKNVPYDVLAKSILKAEGNTHDHGAPMYYVQYKNQPEDATEAITQTFLGVQLQCARCHDHPFESWKQVDFFGMASFLSRLEVVTVGKAGQANKYAIGEKSTGDILFTGPVKEQKPGKKGDPIKPKFLLGDALKEPDLPADFKEVKFEANKEPPAPKFSRKNELAEWITNKDNPFFAKAIANRVWAQYLGRGIVHPVDNMSQSNKPSHPELLDAMAKELVAQKFDLKWLIRELVNSKTYQLSSAKGSGEQFPKWFESARTRPLSAEELAESWRIATGFAVVEATASAANKKTGRFRPMDSGYALRFFGQPNNGVGDFQGGLSEHLYMTNGQVSAMIVTGKGSLFEALNKTSESVEERVDRLFLSVLNRTPNPAEREKISVYVGTGAGADERWKDALWALMTCSEFRFNH